MCHIWDIWYSDNIFCPSGHWSGLVTMIQVNKLFAPGQQPARCSIYRAIVICEMSVPWPDLMTKLIIISAVKSSTDNRLLRGVIREGCLAVAWETVLSSRSLTSLRILCNPINLRQLCPVPGLHTRYCTVTSNSCNWQKLAGWGHQRISTATGLDLASSFFFFFFFF